MDISMNKMILLSTLMLINSPCAFAHPSDNNTNWQTIEVDKQIEIVDEQGSIKTISPSCAFDTVVNPLTDEPLDNSFHFYFKQGKSKNVVVYFNGGGACWNDATCVASLSLASIPGQRPTYNPSILAENSPDNAGGIFAEDEKANPFKDWTKVFIPYCTGDIHVGSSDTTYIDTDGSITGFSGTLVTVKHRGFDNFMAVREWLKNKYDSKKSHKIKKLLVTGSSAGGYGATLNFPYLQAAFPKAKTYLLADASEAIVTQGFIDSVFTFEQVWNVESTLPLLFNDALTTYSALGFNAEIFARLSEAYPNPFTWGLTEADFLYFYEWNARMLGSVDYLSATSSNYQYYIGSGNIHTVLTDAFATDEIPHPFYQEQSAEGVKFTHWLDRFVSSRKFRQQSVKYSD
jgi:hypothetical protein